MCSNIVNKWISIKISIAYLLRLVSLNILRHESFLLTFERNTNGRNLRLRVVLLKKSEWRALSHSSTSIRVKIVTCAFKYVVYFHFHLPTCAFIFRFVFSIKTHQTENVLMNINRDLLNVESWFIKACTETTHKVVTIEKLSVDISKHSSFVLSW